MAFTIKCGPEVFTQSRFYGALFDVCVLMWLSSFAEKKIPRPWCSTEKFCGGVDIVQPEIGAQCVTGVGVRRI